MDATASETTAVDGRIRWRVFAGAALGLALVVATWRLLALLPTNGPSGHWETPLLLVVLGLIGLTYGLLAVGLVVIYRANRIINFAHGEIGAFGAALLGLAVVEWHVPYWIAFVGVQAEVTSL